MGRSSTALSTWSDYGNDGVAGAEALWSTGSESHDFVHRAHSQMSGPVFGTQNGQLFNGVIL